PLGSVRDGVGSDSRPTPGVDRPQWRDRAGFPPASRTVTTIGADATAAASSVSTVTRPTTRQRCLSSGAPSTAPRLLPEHLNRAAVAVVIRSTAAPPVGCRPLTVTTPDTGRPITITVYNGQ